MKSNYAIATILLAMLSGSYALAGLSPAEAIQQNNFSWEAALNKGNTAALMDVYTEDAVVMPPSSEILTSRSAIKTYWDSLLEVGVSNYTLDFVDIRVIGDVAYQSIVWEATRYALDGNVIKFSGNMSNVLKRQKDGNWQISLQSWN